MVIFLFPFQGVFVIPPDLMPVGIISMSLFFSLVRITENESILNHFIYMLLVENVQVKSLSPVTDAILPLSVVQSKIYKTNFLTVKLASRASIDRIFRIH